MESLNYLIKNTKQVHPKIIQNAKEVDIFNLTVKSFMDKDGTEGLIFEAKARALTEGKNVFWDIRVQLVPEEKKLNIYKLPDLNTDCWVQCSCPYFLYFCEYAVQKTGSTEIKYSNGKRPRVTNKNAVPIICKHLVAGAAHVVPAIQKWAKTKVTKKIGFV